MANCVFCATSSTDDVNKEAFITQNHSEDSVIEEHLQVFLVLQKILNTPKELIVEFLSVCNGGSHSEWSVNLCQPCGESVRKFYETSQQILKLERKLAKLKAELNGKIRESGDADSTNLFWKRVRSEVLKQKLQTPEPEQKTSVEDISDGLVRNEGKIIEFEVERVAESREVAASNLHNSSLHSPASETHYPSLFLDGDDEQEENSGLRHPDLPTFTILRRREPRGTFRNNYHCSLCPAFFWSKQLIQDHLKLHEEGSGGVPCPEPSCGWYLLPERLAQHRGSHHDASRSTVRNSSRNMNTSNPPNYTTFNEGGRTGYACLQCPFRIKVSKKGMLRHLAVHGEGSRAVPCEVCGRYVLPERIAGHRRNAGCSGFDASHQLQDVDKGAVDDEMDDEIPLEELHSKVKIEVIDNSTNQEVQPEPVSFSASCRASTCANDMDVDQDECEATGKKLKKCPKCPYKAKRMTYLRAHLKAHEESSGAIECEACGWYVLPSGLSNHIRFHHPPALNEESGAAIYLDYVTFRNESDGRIAYKCRHCPASFIHLTMMKAHAKVHEVGSGAVLCPEPNCGWFVLPEKLARHRGTFHVGKGSGTKNVTREIKEFPNHLRVKKEQKLTSPSQSSLFLDSDDDSL